MTGILERFLNTPARSLAAALLLLLAVGYVDFATGYEIGVSFFYLLPVMLVVWNLGLSWGLLFSALGAVVWLLNDYFFINHPYSHPAIPYWNGVVRLMFFASFAALGARLRVLLAREQAQSKLKSSMIHTVSHEFNNSLTVFSSGLFLLRELAGEKNTGDRDKILGAMEDTRAQMARYVKNILSEARMEAGKFKLERSVFALRDVVGEVLAPVREILKTRGLTLEVRLPPEPVPVSADRDAIALVISNIVSNAVKYTPAGGRITVRVFPRGEPPGTLALSVEDTGIGISLADIDRITEGFYRTDTGKGAAAGFGLGLRVANELLGMHGSRLEIVSEKEKGSRFSFELPVLPPSPKAP